MQVDRGFRDKLGKYVDTSRPVSVDVSVSGGGVYDYSCFGVDENQQISDDRYMIFYNQTSSPNNELTYTAHTFGANFTVDLSAL